MRCPSCGNSEKVHRSHSIYLWEKVIKLFSSYRLYRCHNCGWRGWLHQQTGSQLKRISLRQIFLFFILGFLLGVLITLWQQSRNKPECPQIPINCESNTKDSFRW
ncbi:MAG: hypothetical protein N2746_00875 [Deltaproteobacteria bacterium]|nr:hypothetical protein [Deltaproteobacteria bacterium]